MDDRSIKASWRRLLREMLEELDAPRLSLSQWNDSAEKRFLNQYDAVSPSWHLRGLDDSLTDSMSRLASRDKPSGILFEHSVFDRVSQGLKPGQLACLFAPAWPAGTDRIFSLTAPLLRKLASAKPGPRIGWINTRLSPAGFGIELLSRAGGIPFCKSPPGPGSALLQRMEETAMALSQTDHLQVIHALPAPIPQIRTMGRSLCGDHPPDLLCVDGLDHPATGFHPESANLLLRGLKLLALEQRVPVLATMTLPHAALSGASGGTLPARLSLDPHTVDLAFAPAAKRGLRLVYSRNG